MPPKVGYKEYKPQRLEVPSVLSPGPGSSVERKFPHPISSLRRANCRSANMAECHLRRRQAMDTGQYVHLCKISS